MIYNTLRYHDLIEMERALNMLGSAGWKLAGWSAVKYDGHDTEFIAVMEHPGL